MLAKLLAAALSVLLLSAPSLAREVASAALVDPVVHAYPYERDPGDQCDKGHSGYYWTIDSWFTGEESYAVFCDPTECPDCQGSWKPLSITIYLYWEYENACALMIHGEILEADMSDPSAPVPGSAVTATSISMTAGPFSPPGLWAVTVEMPEDTPGFSEPFFAAIVFEDACEEPPQLVADAGPCNEAASWNDWGIGWDEMCTYGFPGNISIYATLECMGSSAVEDASWTTIKSMYR